MVSPPPLNPLLKEEGNLAIASPPGPGRESIRKLPSWFRRGWGWSPPLNPLLREEGIQSAGVDPSGLRVDFSSSLARWPEKARASRRNVPQPSYCSFSSGSRPVLCSTRARAYISTAATTPIFRRSLGVRRFFFVSDGTRAHATKKSVLGSRRL